MSVVYVHRRLDDNSIFYVGISTNNIRPYSDSPSVRTAHWHNIVNKVGRSVEIWYEGILSKCKEIETGLISLYGRKNLGTGKLINITDGGEGTTGYVPLQFARSVASITHKGKITSEITKSKMSSKALVNNYMKGRTGDSNVRSKIVQQFTKQGVFITEFSAGHEAMRATGVNNRDISSVCRGKRMSAGGFIWKFKTA